MTHFSGQQQKRHQKSTVAGAIFFGLLLSLLLIAFAIQLFGRSGGDGRRSAVGISPTTGGDAAATMIATGIPGSSEVAVTPLVPISIITSAPGTIITLAAAPSGELTLVSAGSTSPISVEQALRAVYDRGVPFALGAAHNWQIPTISAAFGLATFGEKAPDGSWVGDRNIQLPRDKVLDHIENRPMWILDYGNTTAYGSRARFANSVYAVDAETRAVLLIWFYNVTGKYGAPGGGIGTPAS
ncbi:MAG TPA: hypothetical protein PKA95_03105, partial [Thermomicrobiales bacterium]|nr:hypothetical protein [Thermomicrobiales bacterium]